jgi:hypothetical protein
VPFVMMNVTATEDGRKLLVRLSCCCVSQLLDERLTVPRAVSVFARLFRIP